jgi:hypothetical protein
MVCYGQEVFKKIIIKSKKVNVEYSTLKLPSFGGVGGGLYL